MSHESRLGEEWFASLEEFDRQIAEAVAAAGCRPCGGPLHQGNYERKPRGGNIAEAGEVFRLRHSLCCGREGCRKRSLPPSLRFIGRRVYLEAVVLLASALARAIETLRLASEVTGVPARTLRRWHSWWTGAFPCSTVWTQLRALFVPPPPSESELPQSLLERAQAALDACERGLDHCFEGCSRDQLHALADAAHASGEDGLARLAASGERARFGDLQPQAGR